MNVVKEARGRRKVVDEAPMFPPGYVHFPLLWLDFPPKVPRPMGTPPTQYLYSLASWRARYCWIAAGWAGCYYSGLLRYILHCAYHDQAGLGLVSPVMRFCPCTDIRVRYLGTQALKEPACISLHEHGVQGRGSIAK